MQDARRAGSDTITFVELRAEAAADRPIPVNMPQRSSEAAEFSGVEIPPGSCVQSKR
ncbi:hypothetical protein ACFQWF_24220 [Methylorubrum suomiense]